MIGATNPLRMKNEATPAIYGAVGRPFQ